MKFKFNEKEYYIDGYLATVLDSLVYNIKKDWDFLIIITGDRSVRVGKSVIGMTVCAYLATYLNKTGLKSSYNFEDIYFDSKEMMSKVQDKPSYSINHYDEAREALSTSKSFKNFQENLIDFLNECGQLNHIFVLVMPDFFELKENIAVGRSELLINVYRHEQEKMIDLYKDGVKRPIVELKRGFFEFFNKKKKQYLYDKARSTKRKNYGLIKANFVGRFIDQYPLGEEKYRELKREALARFNQRKEEESSQIRMTKSDIIRDKIIMELKDKENLNPREISEKLEKEFGYCISKRYVDMIIKKSVKELAFEADV